MLPGLTKQKGGKFLTVSDPSVVFDAKFRTWMSAALMWSRTLTALGSR